MKKLWRGCLVLFSCLLIAAVGAGERAYAEESHKDYTAEELYGVVDEILQWKKDDAGGGEKLLTDSFLKDAGSTQGDWYTISLGRLGREDDYAAYLAVAGQNVEERYQTEGKLDAVKATEWHRISLAMLATGGDPTDVGESHINLIADGTYNRGKTEKLGAQGVNGIIWGLISLDSLRYKVPKDAYSTRDDIVQMLLESQLADGGFAFGSKTTDPDITGMALTALAPYYNSAQTYTYVKESTGEKVTRTVRQVVDESLETLSGMQLENGCFSSWESENSESISQMIQALSSLGIDPAEDKRFIKNGITLIDVLMGFRMSDGGFIHSREYNEENPEADPNESNTMASEQALYSLTAYLRMKEGLRNLYDCRPEMPEKLRTQIQTLDEQLAEIEKTADRETVERLYDAYQQIPAEERCYVRNFRRLADAMEQLKIVDKSGYLSAAMEMNESGNGTLTDITDSKKALGKVKFDAEALAETETIPDSVTLEYYVPVLKAIYKIEKSKSAEQYSELLTKLKEQKGILVSRQREIDAINTEIKAKLYPFESIGIRDKKTVDDIMSRYEKLSKYEKTQVKSYEDVQKSQIQITSQIRMIVIFCVIAVVVIVLVIIVSIRMKKRRKEKRDRKMLDWEMEDDEDDED